MAALVVGRHHLAAMELATAELPPRASAARDRGGRRGRLAHAGARSRGSGQNLGVERDPDVNLVGGTLQPCSGEPLTGFYRDGCCATGPEDVGRHTVCAIMTAEFLELSAAAGNDLVTPRPEWGFPGLRPGDRWCVCASRWREAHRAGHAPAVVLGATHARTVEVVPIDALIAHAAPADPVD